MKKFKLLNISLLCLAVGLSFQSCSDDDDDSTPQPTTGNNQQTIAAIAQSNNQTDSLVVALSRAGLVSTFDGTTEYTVFAPTNMAFANLINSNSQWNSIADIPTADLTAVLQYHVLNGEVKSSALTENTYGTTLNGQGPNGTNTVLEIDIDGGVTINANQNSMLSSAANVVTPNVDASNGVIHLIDAVITPLNIVGLAQADNRFDSLVVALIDQNLTGALSGNGPFTVFAPINEAFVNLLGTNMMWNRISDIPDSTLTKVLQYHVVSGNNVRASDLSNFPTVTTLNMQNLTVDATNAQLTTTTNQTVGIAVTDVQGTNGVVHAIGEVLLPN